MRLNKNWHVLLIASAVVLPALLFSGAAWRSRAQSLREGENEIIHTVIELRDNIQTTLDAEKRTLVSVDDHVKGMTWKEIADPETSLFLYNLAANMRGIEGIWIADPDGYVRATSEPWGQTIRLPEQGFFFPGRDDETNVYLSTVIEGAPPYVAGVEVVRRRTGPNGTFDGTIHAALSATYLEHYFRTASAEAHHALLVRSDGAVLADDAAEPSYYLPPNAPLMQHIALQPISPILSDRQTLYSYVQVPGFPVYISVGENWSAILKRWHQGLILYAAFAVAASMALTAVSLFAIWRSRSREAALERLNNETQRRLEAERRLHFAQRWETIGQLTAGIAHDFNNMLSVMLGSLEMILRTDKLQSIHQFAQRACRAGERGAHLISTLLTFAGRQILHVERADLNRLVRELLPLIQQTVTDAVRVELMLDGGLLECLVDIGQLEAALMNLTVNARDAMPTGGQFRIATFNARLTDDDLSDNPQAVAGPYAAIAMQDTGIGMSDDVRERMFEPFFTTKDVGKGTGLGLSQVLGFVRQVRGSLKVASKVGYGTTVTLYLPQASTNQPKSSGTTSELRNTA